jgi:hypothetical protein
MEEDKDVQGIGIREKRMRIKISPQYGIDS